MTIEVMLVDDAHPDMVGLIPSFLSETDPRPAAEQFNENYVYGGGWRPMQGFRRNGTTLHYPGDPPLHPIAYIRFREEAILIYPYAWVMILQRDGSFSVARMD